MIRTLPVPAQVGEIASGYDDERPSGWASGGLLPSEKVNARSKFALGRNAAG